MTIPTRPAPPPPQTINQEHQQNVGVNNQNQNYNKITITLPPPPSAKSKICQPNILGNSVTEYSPSFSNTSSDNNNGKKSITRNFPQAKTRYAPSTSWNDSLFDTPNCDKYINNKKAPPPRPPPPKLSNANENKFGSTSGILKGTRPPQSINVLSNLFGRRKSPSTVGNNQKLPPPKIPQLLNAQLPNHNYYNNTLGSSTNLFPSDWSSNLQTHSIRSNSSPNNIDSNDVQLISFDSPPNSPTFTQKSNSDCVSVDSFSSDSNFSSPHNGSASQPESGFEDDFSTVNASSNSTQLTTPVDPWDILRESKNTNAINNSNQLNYMHLNDMKNIDAHPIRNFHILQRRNNEANSSNAMTEKNIIPSQQKFNMPTIIRPKIQKGLAPKPPGQMENNLSKIASNSIHTTRNLENKKIGTLQNSFEDDEPPMPTCPPPPPPSNFTAANFENIQSDFDYDYNDLDLDDTYESPHGIAMYDFNSEEIGDLNFKENDKIYLIGRLNEEWFMGRNKKGCEGIFPCNYIDVKIPLKEEGNSESKSTERTNASDNHSENLNSFIKVLYTFEASHPEDLTIMENGMVKVLYRINEEWLFGEFNNKQGQFPANFIEKIPENLTLKMP